MIRQILYYLIVAFLILGQQSYGQSDKKSKVEPDACLLKVPGELTVERWQISCDCPIKEFHILVYNKRGKQIYESTVLYNSKIIEWDYWNYKKGTYYWIIEYEVEYKKELIRKEQVGFVDCRQ